LVPYQPDFNGAKIKEKKRNPGSENNCQGFNKEKGSQEAPFIKQLKRLQVNEIITITS